MCDIELELTEGETAHILDGSLRHVFRDAPRARAGDAFSLGGKRFEIVDVSERSMGAIAATYYRLERCASPDELIRQWKAGHAGIWDDGRKLYIHWFRDVTGAENSDLA